MSGDRRLVYSTDGSLPLPAFDRPKREKPKKQGQSVPDDGVVRVGCEKRRGGSVTRIFGLSTADAQRAAADLKKRCGTGGTVKEGIVELQGDRRDAALEYFAVLGRRAKRMGG